MEYRAPKVEARFNTTPQELHPRCCNLGQACLRGKHGKLGCGEKGKAEEAELAGTYLPTSVLRGTVLY